MNKIKRPCFCGRRVPDDHTTGGRTRARKRRLRRWSFSPQNAYHAVSLSRQFARAESDVWWMDTGGVRLRFCLFVVSFLVVLSAASSSKSWTHSLAIAISWPEILRPCLSVCCRVRVLAEGRRVSTRQMLTAKNGNR